MDVVILVSVINICGPIYNHIYLVFFHICKLESLFGSGALSGLMLDLGLLKII